MRDEFTWRFAGPGVPLDPAAHVVSGAPESLAAAPRIAVLAHFDAAGRLSASARRYVAALADAGWRSLVVTTSSGAVRWAGELPPSTVVVERPNTGYDFGSWSAALRLVPHLRTGATVILTNDSMIGPFAPLDAVLARAEESAADVWAVTSSLQLAPHLQSYFLRFRPGVLGLPELVTFFDGVRHLTNKVAIVRRYELGLSAAVAAAGLTGVAGFPAASLGAGRHNPTIATWRELMAAGYPFFKRTLLTDPRARVEVDVLRDAVRGLFGADLDAYLDTP